MTRAEWSTAVVEAVTEIASDEGYRQAAQMAGDYESSRPGDAKERLLKLLMEIPT